jgi:hypothetical protein
LALGATGLKGLRPAPSRNNWGDGPPHDRETYTAAATRAELDQAPGAITRRLLGPLLRALAVESHYGSALTDPEPGSDADNE